MKSRNSASNYRDTVLCWVKYHNDMESYSPVVYLRISIACATEMLNRRTAVKKCGKIKAL